MTSQTLSLNSSCKTTTKSHLSQKIQSLLLNNPLLLQRQKHLQELLQIRHQTINFILDKFPEERLFVEYCLENLRKTVIIVGSPRGGTSAYKSLLSQSNHLISMLGEHRHLFTLWGLNFPDNKHSTEVSQGSELSSQDKYFLLKQIYYECESKSTHNLSKRDFEKYAWDWSWRLPMQWPDLSLQQEEIVKTVLTVCQNFQNQNIKNWQYFQVCLLKAFHQLNPHINPWYYDLPIKVLNQEFPHLFPQKAPPSNLIIEVTPYILPVPRKLRTIPESYPHLLIKASSDAYRMGQLKQLFKDHSIDFLHLTRNPLSSINGLLDAWEDRCFWQHDLSWIFSQLDHQQFSSHYYRPFWCFDLFEEWTETFHLPLVEICTRQWLSSHHQIIKAFSQSQDNINYVRFPFEPFQMGTNQRNQLIKETLAYLKVPYDAEIAKQIELPSVISATETPKAGRWQEKRPHLITLLKNPKIAEMCDLLGYDCQKFESWV